MEKGTVRCIDVTVWEAQWLYQYQWTHKYKTTLECNGFRQQMAAITMHHRIKGGAKATEKIEGLFATHVSCSIKGGFVGAFSILARDMNV